MSFLKGKNVLLGVSGSIAAYKSILLLRLLKKEECNVKVILTKSALDFVTPLTFSTLSENQTYLNFKKGITSFRQERKKSSRGKVN